MTCRSMKSSASGSIESAFQWVSVDVRGSSVNSSYVGGFSCWPRLLRFCWAILVLGFWLRFLEFWPCCIWLSSLKLRHILTIGSILWRSSVYFWRLISPCGVLALLHPAQYFRAFVYFDVWLQFLELWRLGHFSLLRISCRPGDHSCICSPWWEGMGSNHRACCPNKLQNHLSPHVCVCVCVCVYAIRLHT